MIVIFARVPEPGLTKTRLIPALGPVAAAHLAAAMTGDVIDLARGTGLPFRVALAGRPDHPWVRTLDCDWEPQAEGDLGRKLAHALRDGGVAIGTDAPTLPAALLHEAHASTADVVIAPAFDGGYVLVGVSDPADVFDLVPWSSPDTFARQHQRALDLGRSVRVLPFWYDVDEPGDVDFLSRHIGTLPGKVAPRTRAWLAGR
ncbi:MAG: TIGR04282 family arsenosugar biosynthesis glycosyltransferase [Deltaproteobacteria bacterium]|nr:TIGR04282 family arsenosugar biosynthesis glycosyltransferase [Deltaproteobacteria bacterium]